MILPGRGRHWNAVPAAKKPRRSGAQVTDEVLLAHLPMGTSEPYIAFDCVVISPIDYRADQFLDGYVAEYGSGPHNGRGNGKGIASNQIAGV